MPPKPTVRSSSTLDAEKTKFQKRSDISITFLTATGAKYASQNISKVLKPKLKSEGRLKTGMGIFTLGFNKEIGENGVYYTVTFDWRERQSEEEKQQLDLIAAFMSTCGDQLIDLEGIRSMTCVDGWSAQQLQGLTDQQNQLNGSSNQHTDSSIRRETRPYDCPSLPAA